MKIRTAERGDAAAISEMLQLLVAAGKRKSPADEAYVLSHYVERPGSIRCSLAVDDDGSLLGFQSLVMATEDNPYGTPVGWGIIGTHVSPLAARRGVGSRLFEVTSVAAADAGLEAIEAFIGESNLEAQAYTKRWVSGPTGWRRGQSARHTG
ncbi:GNAT family N-acetyltransferase [Rhizobium populisoli]|uniref:GNAT family N-acetyltransferase n=1 Tax=Rhizobium populisoli TaxID=2859785 RepID=UPI0028AE84A2|nr:GNAT family N-acetyltransferase [Rhizobium populisoli]